MLYPEHKLENQKDLLGKLCVLKKTNEVHNVVRFLMTDNSWELICRIQANRDVFLFLDIFLVKQTNVKIAKVLFNGKVGYLDYLGASFCLESIED